MLVEALSYFRRGDHAEGAFLTGAILSFSVAILLELGLLVATLLAAVPAVALSGYFARVLATSADGETAPPAFSFSTRLLRDGLTALGVAGAYLLVPTLLLLVTVGGALSAGATDPLAFPTSVRIYAGSAVASFTALAFAYLAPAAVAVVLQRGSLRAGFGSGVTSLAGHAAYFYAWTLALALAAFGTFVAAALAGIPVVGRALAVFVGFYVVATATHLVGRGCARATVRT
jgi:hypothetical protein